MSRSSFVRAAAGIAATVISTAAAGFGGEDVAEGNPWHHEDITIRALAGPMWFGQSGFPSASTCPHSAQQITGGPEYETAGFSVDAACAIAWHADFIDAYLYNPIFWVQGGFDRFKAAMVGEPELLKLHFDDTFTTEGIRSTWERYASGTLIGLYWASLQKGGRGDVAAAHNILGVSVHAVQDFYAHSNWVDDPERRCGTWLQTESAKRDAMTLYSGAYELSEGIAPHHHGAYSPSCSLLRGEEFDAAFKALCTGFSPLQNTSICEGWRMCLAGNAIPISTWGEVTVNQVHTAQQGIALDTIWMARLHAQTRKLLDDQGQFRPGKDGMHFPAKQCSPIVNARREGVCTTDADEVFAGAKDLAIRATIEWIDYIGEAMAAMGPEQAAFWGLVKNEGSTQAEREAAFEELNRLPYLFLSAGPYPVANASVSGSTMEKSAGGWYLRLRIRTLDSPAAGTDADIYAEVAGDGFVERQLLDRLPKDGILTGYDDFEEGDDDVYIVGPFEDRPLSVTLINDDASAADVLEALWRDFTHSLDGAISDIRQSLISLIAGKADYVGTTTGFLTAEAVRPFLTKNYHDSKMLIDGGDQGVYELTYRLRPTPWVLEPAQVESGWQAFEVQARAIKVKRESKVDRGTGGDEPFIIFLVSPLNGLADQSSSYVSAPFPDMQDGDQRFLPRTPGSYKIVRIPPNGGVVIAVRAFESDSENQQDRDKLRLTFETALDDEEREAQARFAHALGAATGPAWRVRSLEAFAFKRDAVPEAGPVLTVSALGEIEGGGESKAYPLDWSKVRHLVAGDFSIASWTANPVGPEVLEGQWYADNFECDEEVSGQTIEITRTGTLLRATKSLGDRCIETGDTSWFGGFKDGEIRVTLNLRHPSTEAVEVNPAPPPPQPDPLRDPEAAAEGWWHVEWQGHPLGTLAGHVLLRRREDGWHYEMYFLEERPLYVGAEYDYRALGAASVGADGSVSLTGRYLCHEDEPCFSDIVNNTSEVAPAGPDQKIGTWRSEKSSGREVWTRAPPIGIRAVTGITTDFFAKSPWYLARFETAALGQRPVRVRKSASGLPIYVDIYGDNMWAVHDLWIAPTPGLEVYEMTNRSELMRIGLALCKTPSAVPGEIAYLEEMPVYGWQCFQESDIIGFRVGLWTKDGGPEAGLYTMYLNGRAVPFIIEAGPETRPMKLAVRSCSLIEEIDGPQPSLIFRRSKPSS